MANNASLRYHSATKLQYAAGELDRDTQRRIPRSTRQRWKYLSNHSFWTPGAINSAKRKPNRGLRAMLYLLKIQQCLLQSFPLAYYHILPVGGYLKNLIRYMGKTEIKRLWEYLPFSYKQWTAWSSRKVCAASLIQLCRKRHPAQLTMNEVKTIIDECINNRFRHWPLSSIYCQLLREQKINCSQSTFYKYCRLLNITRKPRRKKYAYSSVTATAPLKILHMDVTLFKTVNGVKHYLYLIRDNYSRAILSFGLMNSDGTVITDGGAENNGAVTQWLNTPGILWKKLIAQVDIVQSNSMAEAANKILKYRYLFPNPVADTEELVKILDTALADYNNMPQKNLCGLTPNEVLNGDVPDQHRFKVQIANARKRRVGVNRQINCAVDCIP